MPAVQSAFPGGSPCLLRSAASSPGLNHMHPAFIKPRFSAVLVRPHVCMYDIKWGLATLASNLNNFAHPAHMLPLPAQGCVYSTKGDTGAAALTSSRNDCAHPAHMSPFPAHRSACTAPRGTLAWPHSPAAATTLSATSWTRSSSLAPTWAPSRTAGWVCRHGPVALSAPSYTIVLVIIHCRAWVGGHWPVACSTHTHRHTVTRAVWLALPRVVQGSSKGVAPLVRAIEAWTWGGISPLHLPRSCVQCSPSPARRSAPSWACNCHVVPRCHLLHHLFGCEQGPPVAAPPGLSSNLITWSLCFLGLLSGGL